MSVFVVIVVLSGMSTFSWADRTYVVKKGDTLYRISKKYKTDIGTISKANQLDTAKLIPGATLIIPSAAPVEEIDGADSVKEGPAPTSPLFMQLQEGPANVGEPGKIFDMSITGGSGAEDLLMFVTRQTLGIPYKFGSNSGRATDCSGYVQRVFGFMGIQLPRSAREQFNHGESVDKESLSIGDLVFFRTYAPFPSHVGIYLGDNLFVHASALARKVTIDNINTPYYIKRFIGAKRLFGSDDLNLSGSMEISETSLR